MPELRLPSGRAVGFGEEKRSVLVERSACFSALMRECRGLVEMFGM